jgi:hypothetical protein
MQPLFQPQGFFMNVQIEDVAAAVGTTFDGVTFDDGTTFSDGTTFDDRATHAPDAPFDQSPKESS